MIKFLQILILVFCTQTTLAQFAKNVAGNYLLDNTLDSVNLKINKNGTFKKISTSMCSGDEIFYANGKWIMTGDTLTLITDSRYKSSSKKPKKYEYKPESTYFVKNDSLVFINPQNQLVPKFGFKKID